MIVMKFGGSSLASAEKISHCVALVRAEIERDPVVVVSALGKTTDRLLEAADQALDGRVDLGEIEGSHEQLCEQLGLDARVIEPLLYELRALLHGVSLIRELTDRTRDRLMSYGERMSTRVVAAAMAGEGVPATAVNAWDAGVITDSVHGAASPLLDSEERIAAELAKFDLVPVVTGFLGKDEQGHITTLGRSGSDYTASILGAAIGAEEVQIWTDVNGVMTCDPTVDDRARGLPELSFEEASELAYYGAQVLHPSTLVPAIRKGVPVLVRNTARPQDAGTRILPEPVRTSRLAKSVVYKEDVCLIHLASPRLTSAVDLLARSLEVLARHRVGIHMATTSEATVSLITGSGYDVQRLEAALAELGGLGWVETERGKTIVCVVGEELKGTAGVLGKIFGAVSAHGIKAKMVSQSASELNVAFLVDNDEITPAVRALHELLLETS
ncbi:MAG: aspartate kinase [Deltaproteobacteria bacterium]|nr:aspartate kinase [Deltaproteobacteria bacterium]